VALALALTSKRSGLGLGLVHAVLEPIPGSAWIVVELPDPFDRQTLTVGRPHDE